MNPFSTESAITLIVKGFMNQVIHREAQHMIQKSIFGIGMIASLLVLTGTAKEFIDMPKDSLILDARVYQVT